MQENIFEILCQANFFFSLDKIHKELSIKEIIDKLDFIRIKDFSSKVSLENE